MKIYFCGIEKSFLENIVSMQSQSGGITLHEGRPEIRPRNAEPVVKNLGYLIWSGNRLIMDEPFVTPCSPQEKAILIETDMPCLSETPYTISYDVNITESEKQRDKTDGRIRSYNQNNFHSPVPTPEEIVTSEEKRLAASRLAVDLVKACFSENRDVAVTIIHGNERNMITPQMAETAATIKDESLLVKTLWPENNPQLSKVTEERIPDAQPEYLDRLMRWGMQNEKELKQQISLVTTRERMEDELHRKQMSEIKKRREKIIPLEPKTYGLTA